MCSEVILYADPPIVDRIRGACADASNEFSVIYVADSYQACVIKAKALEAPILIVQLKHPVYRLHDFFYDLAMSGISPILLIFDIVSRHQIIYSITSCLDSAYIKRIQSFFVAALENYNCFFNSIGENENSNLVMHSRIGKLEKTEYLKDILRGAIESEFSYYRKKSNLDLKEAGYYLYVYDISCIEYTDHYLNKNIYYLNGEEFIQECQDVVNDYNGGEVFYLEPTLLCIIINDIECASQSVHDKKLQDLTGRLNDVTNCKTAIRYMSSYIKDIRGIREAYESFHFLKADHFFCSEVKVLTPSYVSSVLKEPDYKSIDTILNNIKEFIYHDLCNEQLTKLIKKLFLEIVKPSLDYNLYYYCSVVLTSALCNKYSSIYDKNQVRTDCSNSVFFSTIEQKCDELIGSIDKIKSELSYKRNITNSIVINVIEFIGDSYAENITVSAIASRLNISTSYLSAIFKNEVGIGIRKYIIFYRIDKAKILLSASDLPVYNLSLKVGFTDPTYFSKTFKKVTGLTPLEYRRKNTKIGYIVKQISYRN